MTNPKTQASLPVKHPVIAERIAQIKNGDSQHAFERRLTTDDHRVDHQRVAEWVNGTRAPRAENLRQIALTTGRSVDWILGLPGARELRFTVDDVPPTPDSELALRLATVIAEHLTPEGVRPDDCSVSLPALLNWIGEAIAREIRPKLERQASALQTSEDAMAIVAVTRYLSDHIGATVPEEGQAQFKEQMQAIDARLRRLVGTATQYQFPMLPGLLIRRRDDAMSGGIVADNPTFDPLDTSREVAAIRRLVSKVPRGKAKRAKRATSR